MSEKQLPVDYDKQLAELAASIQSRLSPPGGDRIQVTQDKLFIFPDGTETPGPFHAVIVDFISANYFYKGRFDRQNIQPPVCFALNPIPADLAPSPNAPERQAEKCNVCPNNQFGSDGAGKACKNTRQLALLVVPPEGEINEDTPLWTLNLSPTALKAFDSYVLKVARHYNAPPIKVVSHIGFDPNQSYATIRFGKPEPNRWLEVCLSRMNEARERLLTEPDLSKYAVTAAPKPNLKGASRGGLVRRP